MSEDLEQLRRFNTSVPAPSAAARAQARADLSAAIAATAGTAVAEPRRRGRTRRLWMPRVIIATTTAALCAVALVLALAVSDGRPASAAAATLTRLAEIAASGPSLVPGPGQYLYVSSEGTDVSTGVSGTPPKICTIIRFSRSQMWTAANESGLQQGTAGASHFTSPADEAVCHSLHIGSEGQGLSRLWFAAGCGELGPTNNMQDLSTNPQTLLVQMRRIDGGPRTAAEDFVHVGDFLRNTDASPALRAALYRAAAHIPGVKFLGVVRDHLGRTGLGVAIKSNGIEHELIFNAHTAALMAEADRGSTPGTDDWTAYFKSQVVDKLPKASPLPLTPGCIRTQGFAHNVPGGSVITGARSK